MWSDSGAGFKYNDPALRDNNREIAQYCLQHVSVNDAVLYYRYQSKTLSERAFVVAENLRFLLQSCAAAGFLFVVELFAVRTVTSSAILRAVCCSTLSECISRRMHEWRRERGKISGTATIGLRSRDSVVGGPTEATGLSGQRQRAEGRKAVVMMRAVWYGTVGSIDSRLLCSGWTMLSRRKIRLVANGSSSSSSRCGRLSCSETVWDDGTLSASGESAWVFTFSQTYPQTFDRFSERHCIDAVSVTCGLLIASGAGQWTQDKRTAYIRLWDSSDSPTGWRRGWLSG